MDSAAHRRTLLAVGASTYLGAFLALTLIHRDNLGLGHLFYVPIALVAIGAGPWWGAASGLGGAALYDLAVYVNPAIPWTNVVPQTALRVTAFLLVGALIGYYARRNESLLEELSHLANRDQLTGLPNTRAFETAIANRLTEGRPFALVVGDVDELRALNDDGREVGDDALRRLADRLLAARRGDDVARVGGDEFAVLTDLLAGDARSVALALESSLSLAGRSITFGWASFPQEGENALALYRVADERLYARKVARGYRRGFEHAAS
jgi:diguanylate cyclase (GGDEF)-like protein